MAGEVLMTPQRRRNFSAALGFLQLKPIEPELQLLHRWLDTWEGLGLITVGVERQGYRLSLSRIADGEWRARFGGPPCSQTLDTGCDSTPWRAVQRAAWAVMSRRGAASKTTAVAEFVDFAERLDGGTAFQAAYAFRGQPRARWETLRPSLLRHVEGLRLDAAFAVEEILQRRFEAQAFTHRNVARCEQA